MTTEPTTTPAGTGGGELTAHERALLEFARSHPDALIPGTRGRMPDAVAVDIRETFGIHWARFHQQLNVLVRDPRAMAAYPVECRQRREYLDRRAALRDGRTTTHSTTSEERY